MSFNRLLNQLIRLGPRGNPRATPGRWRSPLSTTALRHCVRLLALALVMGWAGTTTRADVTVLGAQYQQDQPYPEFNCIWNDKSYPTSCTARALGGNVHLYLKNTGAAPVTISDVTLAGYSLKTVLKLNTTVHDARSIYFYWDNPPADILAAGEPVWYKGDPSSIPAGGVAQVVVRLRSVPTTSTVTVGAVTSGGTVNGNITINANAPQLASVGFSQDRMKVYLHWRRSGGAAPVTIRMDGVDVTASTTIVGDPSMNFAESVIQLSSPLAYLSYHVFQGVYADGKTATASLRAWSHPFLYASWGTFSCGDSDMACGRAWVDDAVNHGFNAVQNQLDGGGVADYLGSSAGKAYAESKGYGMIVWNKSSWPDNPLLSFLDDEPDAEDANMERTFCGTGLKLPCGRSPMGILAMREIKEGEDYRATYPNTPTTLNLNGTFKPENYYAYGQAVDVLQVDPYYQKRLKDTYWYHYPEWVPLYRKATYVYAVSKATTTSAEPNPSHVILLSTESRETVDGVTKTWPFPTPQCKRIEAYYALAAGVKGISYWWFKPGYPSNGLGDQSKQAARNLWKEMGLFGNEIKTASHLLVVSHPVDLPLTPGANVWARALAAGPDTLILLVVNDNYYNDDTGFHSTDVASATVTATLPSWMPAPNAFEISAGGLSDVSTETNGNQLRVNLGTLKTTRMVVLTKDPLLRTTIQQRYDQQVRSGVCAIAPELCVNNPPSIAQPPADRTVTAGGSASFAVMANGSAPLRYQWQKGSVPLANGGHYSGCTTPALTIANADENDAAGYRCVVSNAYGSVTSSIATLTVLLPPRLVTLPTDQTVVLGANAGFTVTATGTQPLSYQWIKDGKLLADDGHFAGAATANLIISAVTTNDAGNYAVTITNSLGSTTSPPAVLVVIVPPAITLQPANRTNNVGTTAMFIVSATGTAPLSYQWRKDRLDLSDGGNLFGATTAALSLSPVTTNDAGSYAVRVSNSAGSVLSSSAVLTVNQPPRADASTTVPVVISANGSNAVVILDGSRSSDPEGAPLRYLWYQSGTAATLATGVVAVVTLPVATNALLLVVDDGLDTNGQPFTVEVITTIQAIERLRNRVRAEAERPQPLLVTLAAAIASLLRDNPTAAINQLQAFQNKVRAQVSPDDPSLAEQWLRAAQQIIDVLGGSARAVRGQFTRVERLERGKVWMQLTARPRATHIIEASTNLVDWEKIGAAVDCGDGVFKFSDPNATWQPARFYRIVSP